MIRHGLFKLHNPPCSSGQPPRLSSTVFPVWQPLSCTGSDSRLSPVDHAQSPQHPLCLQQLIFHRQSPWQLPNHLGQAATQHTASLILAASRLQMSGCTSCSDSTVWPCPIAPRMSEKPSSGKLTEAGCDCNCAADIPAADGYSWPSEDCLAHSQPLE